MVAVQPSSLAEDQNYVAQAAGANVIRSLYKLHGAGVRHWPQLRRNRRAALLPDVPVESFCEALLFDTGGTLPHRHVQRRELRDASGVHYSFGPLLETNARPRRRCACAAALAWRG